MGAGGDSRGMVTFLSSRDFIQIAQETPYVSFEIISKNGPPRIKAEYTTGKTVNLSLSRKNAQEIKKTLQLLLETRGQDTKIVHPVKSHSMASQPASLPWNPFTSPGHDRSSIFRP